MDARRDLYPDLLGSDVDEVRCVGPVEGDNGDVLLHCEAELTSTQGSCTGQGG